ncbi:Putative succinate-semialdehyde dehydrogenase [NADP(+)] 2 [bacterium HR15]|nr:Putative succinate-semialdehyde dehydrogenase [NADP(+)] 2 [bacterium HR15]
MNRIVVKSPADGSVLGEVEPTPLEVIPSMVERAHRAAREWQETPLRERAEALRQLRRLLLKERAALAELVAREQGKPRVEALIVEIFPPVDMMTFLIYEGGHLLRPRAIRPKGPFMRGRTCTLQFHPYGVWAVIAPWNYPASIPLVQLVSLVFTGNAALVKPSPLTPLTGAFVVELFQRVNLPDGLVQLVQGGAPQGQALLEHPRVRGVIFTGSIPIGRAVAAKAAETNKKVILELGGKDPAIVLADADLERTARGIAWAAMVNAGQTCVSVERVYVERAIYEPFLHALQAELSNIRVGHPLDDETDMGPVIAPFQRDRVQAHVEDACAKGGRLLTGGKVLGELGELYYAPTLIADAHEGMLGMQEETFGPLVLVQPVADEQEAIDRANASMFGLTASLWTRDRQRAKRLAPLLECGAVTVNSHAVTFGDGYSSWGGFKDSGIGRTHGEFGLYELVQTQYISEIYTHKPELWWYPYSARLRRITDELMAWLAEPSLRMSLRAMRRFAPEMRYLTRHFSPLKAMPGFLRYMR